MYMISACLLGVNCKYNGSNNEHEGVRALALDKDYILVCPEVLAGFSSPRPPAEIREGRVYNNLGIDLTEGFIKGAEMSYDLALKKAEELNQPIEMAILKAKSPSCGCGKIYDGSFSHIVMEGDGITAAFLKTKGIPVLTEEDL